MIKAIRIANFKALGASQRIPLRPITLLFGANSAGKSSVIHALALASHAAATGELDVERTELGGDAIDLGGFRRYVHRHDCTRNVELAFEIDVQDLPNDAAELLEPSRTVTIEIAIDAGSSGGQLISTVLPYRSTGRVKRYVLHVDGSPILEMSADEDLLFRGPLRADRIEDRHPTLWELYHYHHKPDTADEVREVDYASLRQALDELTPLIEAQRHGLLPRLQDDTLLRIDKALRDTAPRGRDWHRLFYALSELLNGIADVVEGKLGRMRYLGPLRSYPPRHFYPQQQDPNWIAGGGYAWDVLRSDDEVLGQVNAWLAKLSSPYEIIVRGLLPRAVISKELPEKIAQLMVDCASKLASALQGTNAVGEHRLASELFEAMSADPRQMTERWIEEIVQANKEFIQDLVLLDKQSGTFVSHRDVGIGVSQVLPVLVSAYGSSNQILAIEQPELHLHPALQADIADVFIDSALGGQRNTFLLETHSEHLILRILRRIRETAEGGLPEGATPVGPGDVAVLYVQPGTEGAEVVHIPVNEEGEFERPWPGGFFPERAEELF